MKTKIELRKFTQSGVEEFKQLLINRPEGLFDRLDELYDDPVFSKPIGVFLEWDETWSTRLSLAKALWKTRTTYPEFEREADDPMLWNWVSCRLFASLHDHIESSATSAKAKKESIVRWIVEESKFRQHRHLVLGPYTAYKNNVKFGDDYSLSQLVQPILAPGEVVERISGKIELAHGEVALLTTWLYVDRNTKKIRDGITSKGEPQQLSKFFNQIAKTVDYQSMTAKELLKMLPKHFDSWVTLAKAEWVV